MPPGRDCPARAAHHIFPASILFLVLAFDMTKRDDVRQNHKLDESVRQFLLETTTNDGELSTYSVPVAGQTDLDRRSRFVQELAKRRKNQDAGLCSCGRPPSSGYRTCTACRSKARLRKRRQREPEGKVRQVYSLLPKRFRQIYKGDLSAALWRYQSERKNRGACVPLRPQPLAFDALSEQRQRFVAKYVTNGRNGQRAALYAGYGARSASKGGRAAAVRASRLLRDHGSEACNRGSGALPLNPMRTRTPANVSN